MGRLWRLPLLVLLAGWLSLSQAEVSFPPLSGRVVDQAGLLDAATEARLTQLLAAQALPCVPLASYLVFELRDGLW